MAENEDTPKDINDVSSPDKTLAEPNSKPVVNGHQFLSNDPMVAGGKDLEPDPEIDEKEKKEPLKEPKPELKVEPIDKDVKPEKPDEAKDSKDEKDKDLKKPGIDKAKPKDEPSEQDIERANAIKQLADNKTYYLPISSVTGSSLSPKLATVFVVLLIIGLVVVYLMK